MSDRTINFGSDTTDATYQIQDDDPAGGGNFAIVNLDTDTVVAKYDPVNNEWVIDSNVFMSNLLIANDAEFDSINGANLNLGDQGQVLAIADDQLLGNMELVDPLTTSENVENFATAGSAGTVPVSQGDGTLQMQSPGGQFDVGNFTDGTTSINVGFEPKFIEVIGQIHNTFNSEESPSAAPLGQSHGFATGTATSEQYVVSEGDNSDSVNGHFSFAGDGEVVHVIETTFNGESLDTRSVASVSAFTSTGFDLNWSETGADAHYIYKAQG